MNKQSQLSFIIGLACGIGAALLVANSKNWTNLEQNTPQASEIIDAELATAADMSKDISDSTSATTTQQESDSPLIAVIAQKDKEINELQLKVKNLSQTQEDSYRPEEDTKEIREAMIGELLELTSSKEMIESSFDNVGQMLGNDLNDEQKDKLKEIMKDVFSWDKLEPAFYSIYSEVFTANELYEINKFYRSDIGKTFVTKTPELQAKTISTIQKTMADSLPRLQEAVEDIKRQESKKKDVSH